MTTLTDFLLARIAEDKRDAREVHDVLACSAMEYGGITPNTCDCGWPEQVAADCEAKRRIVEALVDAEAAVATYDNDDPLNPPSYWQEWGNRHALRMAAELHAATYADHPDYNPDWRP